MLNSKVIEFKKDSIIFVTGGIPNTKFYKILFGSVEEHIYGIHSMVNTYNENDIIGIVSAVIGEPYYSTIIAKTNVTLLEIDISTLDSLDNSIVSDSVYTELIEFLDIWFNKYFDELSYKLHIDHYIEKDALKIAKIYEENGHKYTALKMYKQMKDMFPNENTDLFNRKIEELDIDESLYNPSNDICNYLEINDKNLPVPNVDLCVCKPGCCVYSELENSNNIYILKSGTVGIYNIFNDKIVTRMIAEKGSIIGYRTILGKEYLKTTGIVLEDAQIQIVRKDVFYDLTINNNIVKYHLIKVICRRIYNAITKLYVLNIKSIISKIYNLLYALVKTELLFNTNNDIKYVKLEYKVDDISSMLGIFDSDRVKIELENDKIILIDKTDKIVITDLEKFYQKYEKLKRLDNDKLL